MTAAIPNPMPLYERFTVHYPVSGTELECFYAGGATLREAEVTHPMARVEPVLESRVSEP